MSVTPEELTSLKEAPGPRIITVVTSPRSQTNTTQLTDPNIHIAHLTAQLAAANAKIADLEAKNAELTHTIYTNLVVESQVESLTTQLNAANATIASQKSNIAKLMLAKDTLTEIKEAQESQIASLQQRLQDANMDILGQAQHSSTVGKKVPSKIRLEATPVLPSGGPSARIADPDNPSYNPDLYVSNLRDVSIRKRFDKS